MKHTTEDLILAALVINRTVALRGTIMRDIPGEPTAEQFAQSNAEATRQAFAELLNMADTLKEGLQP